MERVQINQVVVSTAPNKTSIVGRNRYLGHNGQGICALIRLDYFKQTKNIKHEKLYDLKGPYTRSFDLFLNDIKEGNIHLIDGSKYEFPKTEADFIQSELVKLDEYRKIMGPIIKEPLILFDRHKRNAAFTAAAGAKYHPFTLRRFYNLYLYYGHNSLIFAPHYSCRGGIQKKGTIRRGRLPENEEDRDKAVLLCDFRVILIDAARKLYFNSKDNLRISYHEMLRVYFYTVVYKATNPNIPIEELSKKYPNFSQWYYTIKQLRKDGAVKLNNKRKLIHPSKNIVRPAFGTALDDVYGPGDRYEIDSTRIQVHLVSRFGRELLVGEPNLYLIVDVWSGLIVGFALSLENPSFALAAEALRCCFTPKMRIFEELGLKLVEEDWPCNHLPSRLMADRAECISDKAGVIPDIGIDLDIASPMRPDMKGTVEGKISEFKNFGGFTPLPGSHIKFRTRRDPNGKETASLTIIEMYIMVVYMILELNRRPATNVPLSLNFSETTTLTRNQLFTYGLKHRSGCTKIFSEKWVADNLLAKGIARVKEKGLYFRGERFLCSRLNEIGYLVRAKKSGSFMIEVRFNEHRGWEIWFRDPETKEWVIAVHAKHNFYDEKVAFFEVKEFKRACKKLKENTSIATHVQNKMGRETMSDLVKTATAEAKIAKCSKAGKNGKGKIRANRFAEKESLKGGRKTEINLQDKNGLTSNETDKRDEKDSEFTTNKAQSELSNVTVAIWDND